MKKIESGFGPEEDPPDVGKTYSLDLGQSFPVVVKVIAVTEDAIEVEYLNSWAGRRETLSKETWSWAV